MSIDQADWQMTPDEERKLEEKYESRRTEHDIVRDGVNEMRERHGRREAMQKKRDSDLSMSAGSVPKCPNCNGRGWVESHLLGGSKVWCGMRKCEARDAEIQSQNH